MAQSVELILGFGSGHDLMVCGFQPCVRLCAGSLEPAWDSVSLSLCPSLLALSLSLSLSLSKEVNKYFSKKNMGRTQSHRV